MAVEHYSNIRYIFLEPCYYRLNHFTLLPLKHYSKVKRNSQDSNYSRTCQCIDFKSLSKPLPGSVGSSVVPSHPQLVPEEPHPDRYRLLVRLFYRPQAKLSSAAIILKPRSPSRRCFPDPSVRITLCFTSL